jgi:hypothetical protein
MEFLLKAAGCGLNWNKGRGLFVNLAWILSLGFIFEWKISWTRSTNSWTATALAHGGSRTEGGGTLIGGWPE